MGVVVLLRRFQRSGDGEGIVFFFAEIEHSRRRFGT